jgi:putative transposase
VVEPICAVLTEAGAKITPSTYYTHRTRPPSARSVTDAATTAGIETVHAENYGVYGARKVHAEVRRQGHRVARCTEARNHVPTCFRKSAPVVEEDGERAGARVAEDVAR